MSERVEWRDIRHWRARAVAAEARVRALEEALRRIADSKAFGNDTPWRNTPTASTPYEWARNVAREALVVVGRSQEEVSEPSNVRQDAGSETDGSLTSPVGRSQEHGAVYVGRLPGEPPAPDKAVHPMMVNGVICAWCHRRPNECVEILDRLRDAATVIERMANGATRAECSPELDRVKAALAAPPVPQEPGQAHGLGGKQSLPSEGSGGDSC